MTDLKFTYSVFSADEVVMQEELTIDGEKVTVHREALSVQLTNESDRHGTIVLNVVGKDRIKHPFVVGETVTVTFSNKKGK